jgi:hypothetical protein
MPLDLLGSKICWGAVADPRKQIFFGMFAGQTKPPGLDPVNAIGSCRGREVRRANPEACLPGFLSFEELAHHPS